MNRLAICLPHLENVKAKYAFSLASMILRLGSDPPGGDLTDVVTLSGSGSILPAVRQDIAERAIEKYKASHLLWIDSDHSFPPDTAHRLIAHDKAWVGINATTRAIPIQETAINLKMETVKTGPHEKGLERVRRMGFGIALIRADVFTAIKKPWFLTKYVKVDRQRVYQGEDVYFCEKARKAGYHPFVDHDLTKETAHIGEVGFTSAMLDEASQMSA